MTTMKETNIEDKAIIEWQKLTIANRDERIDLLESAIRDAAEYHRSYVGKLKESDPERSARQQDRVNYFMSILENEK
ncbi:MAG TPA: hypothetical protein VIH30_08125 [Aquirhabdus sp.]